jgi:hypothetical protein
MTTTRRTYYVRRKTSTSSNGKKSKSKRRNLRGGMRLTVISERDGAAIKNLFGEYTIKNLFGEYPIYMNLKSFTDENLIKHREALYAKQEELKDCYMVGDLSQITSREYGYPDMKKYFKEQIDKFDQEIKTREIYESKQSSSYAKKTWMKGEVIICEYPMDYTEIEWLKPHRGIGIPQPVSVCANAYFTKGWTK